MTDAIEKTRSGPVFAPSTDIAEKEGEFVVWADMPGADPKSVEVSLEGEYLTVRAKVVPPDVEGLPLLYREYTVGDYEAGFRVSVGIDRDKINAELKDGVLVLTLPKAEEVKPRKIEIKAA
jgi:HSP20 family protein